MTTHLAIDVKGLSKRFGRRDAVASLDLTVPVGAVSGFIGPNGAGKTTTLRMLLGLIRPTSGVGTVLGHPLTEPTGYLPRVGALIESPAFHPGLSGRRNLEVLAVLGGRPLTRVDDVLAEVGLADRAEDPYRAYSLGMKQRLGIAAALLGEPALLILLILDEPTNGLDPAGIQQMRNLLRTLASRGLTMLVSSHLLAELEQVWDWLVIIDHGEQVYQGPADELLNAGRRSVWLRPENPDQLGALAALAGGFDAGIRLRRHDARHPLPVHRARSCDRHRMDVPVRAHHPERLVERHPGVPRAAVRHRGGRRRAGRAV